MRIIPRAKAKTAIIEMGRFISEQNCAVIDPKSVDDAVDVSWAEAMSIIGRRGAYCAMSGST